MGSLQLLMLNLCGLAAAEEDFKHFRCELDLIMERG